MGSISQLVSRFAGGGRRTGRPTGGSMGSTGTTGATGGAGGTSAKDEAIGRGVRSVLGRFRR